MKFIHDRMKHRHLDTTTGYTAAAIDDLIGRGSLSDWCGLRQAADSDRSIMEKIFRVCAAKVSDPYEQRYHLWRHHAELAELILKGAAS